MNDSQKCSHIAHNKKAVVIMIKPTFAKNRYYCSPSISNDPDMKRILLGGIQVIQAYSSTEIKSAYKSSTYVANTYYI